MTFLRARPLVFIASLIAAVAVPAASHAAEPAKTVTVEITHMAYSPKELSVAPGTHVHWINKDETPHTVTSVAPSKVLKSKALDTDDGFDFTFDKEGDFAYLCTVHPFMTGVVHVKK